MAVCSRCNGNGSVLYPIDYEKGLFDETNCDLCGGSGEVLTNEEWFASLPITEKSSFLAKMVTEAIKEHGKCGATRCESSIWWDEWLKQPKE